MYIYIAYCAQKNGLRKSNVSEASHTIIIIIVIDVYKHLIQTVYLTEWTGIVKLRLLEVDYRLKV